MIQGLVSVIMSNYNTNGQFLREAIESILAQTYEAIEFIIVDDCSTDDSLLMIRSYADIDKRIKIIRNAENLGITKSLNRALNAASGEFVARMDADDISVPTRIQKQVDFMRLHTDTVVCGTYVQLFGGGASKYKQSYSKKIIPGREEFQINLLFGNQINIIHPTAMFRNEILKKNSIRYNENYLYAQDYRMWVDCCRVGECANVPEVLLKYRIHDKAVSEDKKNAQHECAKRVMEEQLSWLHLSLPSQWEEIHYGFLTGRKKYDVQSYDWIRSIIDSNKKYHVFNQQLLEDILWRKWIEITYFEFASNTKNIGIFLKVPIKYYPELILIWRSRKSNKPGGGG